jgi:GntR family transcriptional regulator
MNIQIDKNSPISINEQIKEQITGLIHAGQIKTGDRLPTIRKLSVELSINVNTVALAYRDLDNDGVIITERGKGSFVSITPSEEEMQTIRQEKLRNMVTALVREADRLGYTDEEVGRAFIDQYKKRNM